MDKNAKIATVVNKTDVISNEFRVFPMEVIAGDSNLVAEVRRWRLFVLVGDMVLTCWGCR